MAASEARERGKEGEDMLVVHCSDWGEVAGERAKQCKNSSDITWSGWIREEAIACSLS